MRIIDFNSLNGGVVLGAHQSGCKVLFAANASSTFKKNLPDIPVGSLDNNAQDIPRPDIISMTISADPNQLAKMRVLIEHIKPRYILAFGKPNEEVSFTSYGKYGEEVVNASMHDVPQNRVIKVLVLTREDVIRKSMYFPMPEDGPVNVIDSHLEAGLPVLSILEQVRVEKRIEDNRGYGVRFGPKLILRGEPCPRLRVCKYYIKEDNGIRQPSQIELNRFMGFPDNFEVLSEDMDDFLESEIPASFAARVITELKDWI